jgi:hypothetical protein
MDVSQERMRILDMIDSGRISAEQGLSLLQALNAAGLDAPITEHDDEASFSDPLPLPGGNTADEVLPSIQPGRAWEPGSDPKPASANAALILDPPRTGRAETLEGLGERTARLKRLWVIPMWAGMIVATIAGSLMYAALLSNQGALGLLFLCASGPFVLGLLVMFLAWSSRAAPWLHLRVQQAPGATPQRIALSFPLPVGVGAWFVRIFSGLIPGLRDRPVEDLLRMVQQTATSGEPIHIEVDEGEYGEKVEIFIG